MYKIGTTYIAFQKRIWVFQTCRGVFIAYFYLAFFGAIWLFLRVDLAFFAYDYLATLLRTLYCNIDAGEV